MKICIEFEDDEVWEAADALGVSSGLFSKRLLVFSNSRPVKKMLLEGTLVDPFPVAH